MNVEIREELPSVLEEYAQVSSSFEVTSIFDLATSEAFCESRLFERVLLAPYTKHYDSIPGNHPVDWLQKFGDINWRIFSARVEGRCVGGAVVARNSLRFDDLVIDTNVALLWDLRVSAEMRRRGIASALFAAAEVWAIANGYRRLKVETQNINVTACKFYASRGCQLSEINHFAYPKFPDEIQLIWTKPLPAN